ncbi:MAG: hypothetical protein GX431_08390 [Bacteroidales bacterium]|nr:hypothetical protein [Bacteroidales bacterium]
MSVKQITFFSIALELKQEALKIKPEALKIKPEALKIIKPEALKSNIHGYIRGGVNVILLNRGAVEELFQNFSVILFLC